jgi:hypothetical protein
MSCILKTKTFPVLLSRINKFLNKKHNDYENIYPM